MENYPIKGVTFGGFNKQDVIQYIERTAREAFETQQALEKENGELRQQLASVTEEVEALRRQTEVLRTELQAESDRRQELEPLAALQEEVDRLTAENQALRPDAEAYAQFREGIGAIECEARKRAADLEDEAAAKMRQVVDQFLGQYQTLMSTFETTASYVTSELRKVEVNLAQLPRAMDRPGAELKELTEQMERSRREKA